MLSLSKFVNSRSFRLFYGFNPTSRSTTSPIERAEEAIGEALQVLQAATLSVKESKVVNLSKFEREAIALRLESHYDAIERIREDMYGAILKGEEAWEAYWNAPK
jgi:hypothetical protein